MGCNSSKVSQSVVRNKQCEDLVSESNDEQARNATTHKIDKEFKALPSEEVDYKTNLSKKLDNELLSRLFQQLELQHKVNEEIVNALYNIQQKQLQLDSNPHTLQSTERVQFPQIRKAVIFEGDSLNKGRKRSKSNIHSEREIPNILQFQNNLKNSIKVKDSDSKLGSLDEGVQDKVENINSISAIRKSEKKRSKSKKDILDSCTQNSKNNDVFRRFSTSIYLKRKNDVSEVSSNHQKNSLKKKPTLTPLDIKLGSIDSASRLNKETHTSKTKPTLRILNQPYSKSFNKKFGSRCNEGPVPRLLQSFRREGSSSNKKVQLPSSHRNSISIISSLMKRQEERNAGLNRNPQTQWIEDSLDKSNISKALKPSKISSVSFDTVSEVSDSDSDNKEKRNFNMTLGLFEDLKALEERNTGAGKREANGRGE